MNIGSEITAKQAGIISQRVGLKQMEIGYQQYFLSTLVGQKHPRDCFDNDNAVPPKTLRNRSPLSMPTPAVSAGMNARNPSPDIEYEGEEEVGSDEDGEGDIILVPYGRLPVPLVSVDKIAASSTSSKGLVSSRNRTAPSAPPAPFEPSLRSGAPSTAPTKFDETGSDTPPALRQHSLESPSGKNDKVGQALTDTPQKSVYHSEGANSDSVEGLSEEVSNTAHGSLQEKEDGGSESDSDFEPVPTTTPNLPVKFGNTAASSTEHQKSVQFVQQAGSTTMASTASPQNKLLQAVQYVAPSTTSTAPIQLSKVHKSPVRVGGMPGKKAVPSEKAVSGKKAVPSEKALSVKTAHGIKNANSSSTTAKAKKNVPAKLQPVSDSTKARRTGDPIRERYDEKMPKEDRGSCELILQTFLAWIRLYEKRPSPFLANLSESFWGRNSWPLLNDLFFDIDNIFMIDGEKGGLESSRRKNMGRKWIPDGKTAQKRRGRKLDLIARDVLQERDWLIVERMLKWDVTSNKFLKETTIDLLREMHTIQTFRLQDCLNTKFKDEAHRGFQSFELMPAPQSPYVTFIKEHPIYNLPTSMTDNLRQQAQGLVHLLRVRLAMIHTLEAYHRPQESKDEQVELGEELCDWLYGNNCEIKNPETVLASSPFISPVSSPAPSVDGLPLDEESSHELSHEQLPNNFQDTDGEDDIAALNENDDIGAWLCSDEEETTVPL
ncbi:hypothetical protein BG000_009689 [Podila horticola]|nr:hypothetical protein BG000_009689 [Podila horticola]